MKSFEWELERVPWAELRTMEGNAASIPAALRALAAATTEEEAKRAYWRIDNTVVVQGNRFQAAEMVIRPLLDALPDCSDVARLSIVDLLVELAHEDEDIDQGERDAGNAELARKCIERLREGLALYYHLLDDPSPRTRYGALDLIDSTDRDDERFVWYLERVAQVDPSPRLREYASQRAVGRRSNGYHFPY